MKTLREYVADALARKVAIGHFNISNIEGFWAVVRAAKELNVPVIIGVSEGERSFIGVEQVRALVNTIQKTGQPVFLNADHTYSYDKVAEVVDAGFDSVIYDGAATSFDDNVATTKKCADYARATAKKQGRDILVEGELGFIGQSSQVHQSLPTGVNLSPEALTKPEDAKRFVEATGIDMLAPAVGNFHGLVGGNRKPNLNIARIREIAEAVRIPMVLHGGSGETPENYVAAIDAGMAIIHVNTEIRVAYRKALKRELADNLDEVAPYKIMKPSVIAMQAVITEKLKIFNKIA